MVRSSYLAVAGTTVAALALVSAINCGGSTENATTGTGGKTTSSSTGKSATSGPSTTTGMGGGATSSSSSGPFMPMDPPPPPAMTPPDGTAPVTMAIKKLYLGDTDPDGTPDMANGWEHFGYNIDGVNPNDLSKFCKTVDNASPSQVHQEGLNGIENSFGHNILPIVLGIASDASSKINADIAAGKFTVMIQQDALGTGSTYDPVTARLFLGSATATAPKFDGTDDWPVSPVLLNDNNPDAGAAAEIAAGSKVTFPMSYVTNNTWVSGTKGNVTLALSVSGYTLNLNIANAVITMDMDPAHMGATKGIISGVLKTSDLTSQIQMVAGSFDPSLCSGPTIQSIIMQLSQASDILSDGTQDPTKTCDGISIGIGFDAALVKNPDTVGPEPTMAANPCGDAG